VVILDVDVHHGNGNERVFLQDPSVLHISLHRYGDTVDGHRIMPASGCFEETGQGEGAGFNLNFEMRLGDGDAEYADVCRQIVFPVIAQFQPELVVLLAGFDALDHSQASRKFRGPGMDCAVTPTWYWWLANQLQTVCPKILASTEGGYDPKAAALGGECLVRGLLGESVPPQFEELVKEPPKDRAWKAHLDRRRTHFAKTGPWKI
jgi:acetoin utilization deacetylase AcuC-like enzyme